ncbi:MAG TPA: protein kinase [Polyangia bacterium]|nr:protein kinase [Polyangia bacterium]
MESTLGLIGLRIGNYRVISQIGQGGMGAVYLADHEILGRKAAVKVLLPELSKDPGLIARFFNEARATAQLRHRGFVEIFDSGTLPDGSAYLVMDFLRGANLADCIEHQRVLPPAEAIEILREVAASVEIAHRHGIVHRDLKPDNIYLAVETDGVSGKDEVLVKVLDFGIAKLNSTTGGEPGRERPSRTRTGALLGTPLFMSPEQCRGAGQVDHRSDIYSLGCIAYNMLTGRPPFPYEGFGEIISAHLTEHPASMRMLMPQLPGALDTFVLGLLAKAPGERPPSMEAVATALEQIATSAGAQGPADLRRLIPARALRTEVQSHDSRTPPRIATTPFPAGTATPLPGAAPTTPAAWIGQSGETKLLPSQPGYRPAPTSTLGAAASELRPSRRLEPERRGRGLQIALGLIGLTALGGGALLYLRGPNPMPTPARPPAALDLPPAPPAPPAAPQATPEPEPAPPARPRAVDDTGAGLPTADLRRVQIFSEPSHANVVDARSGKLLGTTPFILPVPRAGETLVSIRKRGYHSKELIVNGDEQTASVVLERKSGAEPRPTDETQDDDQRKL